MDDNSTPAILADEGRHAAELLELGDAFLEVDRDWRVIRVNRNQERLSQRPRERTLGRVLWDVWPETAEPTSLYWREYHRCMDERAPVQFEAYFEPLDLWTGVTAYPVSSGGIAVFFRDVTAQKRAEQSVRAERDFSDAVLETLASLVVVLDPGARIVRFNRACERTTGYSADEVVGRSVFELLIPEADLSGAAATFARLRVGDFPNQHRNRWRTKDGSERMIAWSNTAIPDARGAVEFIIATGVDVTDREQAIEALRDSEERFRSVFDSAAVGIGRVALDGRFLQVNEAYARLVGYTPDELLQLDFQRITHPEDLAADTRRLSELRAGMVASYRMDKRYVRKDGSIVWVSLSVGLARDAAGRPAYCSVVVEDISARKLAEEAVRDSEALFRSVFEQAAIGMGRVRFSDARWVDVNEAFCRMLGRSREEMLRVPWPEMTHPDDLGLDLVRFREMAAGGLDAYTVEKRFLHASGEHVWAKLTLSVVRDAAGEPEYEIAIIEDIGDRKRAEAGLAAALDRAEDERRRLTAVLEALPAGVVITDAKGGFTHVNAEFKRIWGAPPTPRSAEEYAAWHGWWPDTGAPVATEEWALSRALTTGDVIVPGDVVEIEKFDGSGRATIINAAAPIRNARGEIVGGVLAEVDITVQKRTEGALRDSQRLLRSTMDHLPTVIAFKDRDGRFLDVNPQVERALGLPKERIVGRTMHAFVPREAAEVLARHDEEVMESRRAIQREEVTPLPTGTLHHLNVAFPLIDAGGRVYGTGHISHDITALKRVEGALREANEKLREADRRKDEFLGMLSHELRNPLAPIRNALYLLDRAQADGQQARRAKDIVARQVSHLTRLVDDLLDVTRIARGKIQLRHEDLDLGTLVRRTAEDYRPLMQDRGIELVVRLPQERVGVNGDPARLTQIFGNLLNNAAKFTPAGGQVALSLDVEDGRAAVRVRDTGSGIAPDVLPTIFEPFTQGKQTLARSEGGLGLGLSLVKGLVTLHGGDVVAVSGGPERGTEFVVFLPIAVGRRRDAAGAGRDCATNRATAPRRVLVIDDNRDAADTLAQLIEMLGHRPVVAYDAFAGLAKASEDLPDVVLCDIGLPGMDGYEFARQFRALASTHGVRLVALSGYAQPEDVARAAEAGFDAHVAKPPDPERLATLLG